jgi:fibrillarin-like pre-rRNA processing protein
MKLSPFAGIWMDGKRLFTRNLVPGRKVYDETLVKDGKIEYREWNPNKSKLAAALAKGLQQFPLKEGHIVLYLGASTGTTVSHVSDIVGKGGLVFAVELGPRVMRELLFLAQERKNIAPILADAFQVNLYANSTCLADFVFQDIAQKNQAAIFLRNVDLFLKEGSFCAISVKAKSIDVTKKSPEVFAMVKKQLEEKLVIVDTRKLQPYEKDHVVYVCKKK